MPVYEGNCEKCGKPSKDLLMFRGKTLCESCIKEGRKPVDKLTAQELKNLIRMAHPYEKGEPYFRAETMEEIERRGESFLNELGWPTDTNAMYRNRYTGDEETLGELLLWVAGEEEPEWKKGHPWYELFSIVENWEPAIGPNIIRAKYLAEQKLGRGVKPLESFAGVGPKPTTPIATGAPIEYTRGDRDMKPFKEMAEMRREAAANKVLEIIKKLEEDYGGVAPLKEVKLRAGAEGISESFVEQIILEEKKLGHLYEPKIDMISMAITQPQPQEKPKLSPQRFELGDYVLYGARVMVFGGIKDGEILLRDPFYPKGEYDLTVTKEEFEGLELPTREHVISEYERLERKKPADFETRLAKLPTTKPPEKPAETVGEHAERWSREFEEAKKKAEAEKPRATHRFGVKIEVTGKAGSYSVGMSRPESENFYQSSSFGKIPEVEEFVARGEDEIDMYEALRSVGDKWIILSSLPSWGFASFPELQEAFKKVEEERWDDITDEEEDAAEKAWGAVLKDEWILTWTAADVKWSPDTLRDKEIYYHKYGYDQLMAMKRAEIDYIAKVKGLSKEGRMEDVAQRIHQSDYGAEEAKSKLSEIDKLLG
jgi:hypothetical protein